MLSSYKNVFFKINLTVNVIISVDEKRTKILRLPEVLSHLMVVMIKKLCKFRDREGWSQQFCTDLFWAHCVPKFQHQYMSLGLLYT